MGDRPVIYLDVDGVLWDVIGGAPNIAGPEEWAKAANGCLDFITWALWKCEVRWCTTWAMSGAMGPDGLARLERHTKIPASTWAQVRPSLGWMNHKTEAIAWDEHRAGRPFAWIEDGITPREAQTLAGNGFLDSYVHTDVFEDPDALVKAHEHLMRRFGL